MAQNAVGDATIPPGRNISEYGEGGPGAELPHEIQDLEAQVEAGFLTEDEAYAQAETMGYDTSGYDSNSEANDTDWDASGDDGVVADLDDDDEIGLG